MRKKEHKKEKESQKENEKPVENKLEKYSHWKFKTLVVAISLIVLILLFLIALRLNFFVSEQLRMTIDPEYSEITTASPGIVHIDTDVKIYNKFVCEAICNYSLVDLSDNVTLDKGSFISKTFKNEHYNSDIALNDNGYGRKIYLYRIECVNEYTALCPDADDRLVRKSTFIVSYVPNDEQLSALDYSRQSYNDVVSNYVNASKIIGGTGKVIGLLGLNVDTKAYNEIDSSLSSLSEDMNKIISIWRTQNLLATKKSIIDYDIVNKSQTLFKESIEYNNFILTVVQNHNVLANNIQSLYDHYLYYNKFSHLGNFSYIDASKNYQLTGFINGYESMMNKFDTDTFENSNLTYTTLSSSTIGVDTMILTSVKSSLNDKYISLHIFSNALCNSNYTYCTTEYEYVPSMTNVYSIFEAYPKINDVCSYSGILINNLDYSDMNLTTNESIESLLFEYKYLLNYESAASGVAGYGVDPSTVNSVIILSQYKLYLLDSLSVLGITDPNTELLTHIFNNSIKFSSNDLIFKDIIKMNSECNFANKSSNNILSFTPKYYNESILNDPVIYAQDVTYKAIPEMVPQCCMYGKCQSCNKKSTGNPLILLHGHAFIENAHAYRSVEIFDGFESSLSEDEIYYPSGMLIPKLNSTMGIFDGYNIPLVIKPTYYLETYNDLLGLKISEAKKGNIDTYALRLKEYIDYTKYLTGSEKVDIVAHSMGGLVVRRYIQIFGADSLGTVILIGSPNNGITSRTYAFCKIFGTTNECDDMKTDGLFLKKLNDYSKTSQIDKMYLVIGRGCDTEGSDGDGVVAVNNSLLKSIPENHILYVEGKCTGTRVLHNDMLDKNLYPEVYAFVKSTLEENN